MKNFKKLFLALMMGSVALTYSCSKTADNTSSPQSPSLSVTPQDQNAAPGTSVTYSLTANSNTSSNSGLAHLKISVTVPGGGLSASGLDSTLSKKPTNFGYDFHYTLPKDAPANGVYTITFTLTDAAGLTATSTRNVTAMGSSSNINSYTVVLLNAPSADKSSKTFYSTTTNARYSKSDADGSTSIQSLIDFGYYYLTTAGQGAILSSPGSYNKAVYDLSAWSNKNATTFGIATVSAADFDAASDDTKIKAQTVSSGDSKNLSQGQIIAFKTGAGKMGLIKITNVTPGYSGSITFDVKVQK
jgi:hypothetical protein